jgi:hypothetical protein
MSITAIKNFTVNADLGSASSFYRQTNFGFQPTMAIVRHISYMGPNPQEIGTFLIWSSLINDFIGSFSISNYGAMLSPQTQIFLPAPVPNQLQFKIYAVGAVGAADPYDGLLGDLSIQIDFIKY